MSLSDCIKCWETPCTCGWDFRKKPDENIKSLIEGIIKYRKGNTIKILKKILAKKRRK